MGGGGAWLVDGNRETLKSSGHSVEGCDIHHFGRGESWMTFPLGAHADAGKAHSRTIHAVPAYAEMFPAVKDLPDSNPHEPVKNVIAHNRFIRGEAVWISKYAPKLRHDPRWWRGGDVTDEQLRQWGVFEDNQVDNSGLVAPPKAGITP